MTDSADTAYTYLHSRVGLLWGYRQACVHVRYRDAAKAGCWDRLAGGELILTKLMRKTRRRKKVHPYRPEQVHAITMDFVLLSPSYEKAGIPIEEHVAQVEETRRPFTETQPLSGEGTL
jgi:hypothetical protein